MMAALKKNSLDVIRMLVEAGSDIKQRNKDGWTALNIASRTNDVQSFQYLLSLDPSGIFIPGYNGRTILHTICVNASTDIYQFLMKNLSESDIIQMAKLEDNSGGTCCHEIVINS